MKHPLFLKSLTARAPQPYLDKTARSYQQLLGIWLIDLALILSWHRPRRDGRWSSIFYEDNFCLLTGLQKIAWSAQDAEDVDDDENINWLLLKPQGSPDSAGCRRILLEQRACLQGRRMSKALPLFANIGFLSQILGLSQADQGVLTFAIAMQAFPQFRQAIATRRERVTAQSLYQILEKLMRIPAEEFADSLEDDGLLITTGIVELAGRTVELENKLDVIEGFGTVLTSVYASADDMVRRFIRKASPPTLNLDNFPHLTRDSDVLLSYLGNAVGQKVAGVNILLHGKPGVGKTEYVQALAERLGIDLYEIEFSDEKGDPIKGESRLRAYNLCQRFLAQSTNALLLFDEVEDVFPAGNEFLSRLFGGDESPSGGRSAGKAWINRTLERNLVPAIWVSNSIGQIDPAYKRRFDYSVAFPLPPKPVRLIIAEHHLGCFNPPAGLLERLSANEDLTPGQLSLASKVAMIASPQDSVRAIALVEQTLDRSITLLGQKCTPSRNVVRTGYSLDYLNTDADIAAILSGLRLRPRGSFCFYGAAGTGKSELARHLADEIGKPFLLRRASDLLSKWLGESEQNIAAMFNEARQQDAVLVLDEADSFLADRRDAQRRWEVTQVNELLTQMEAFDGIFVCTTNLMAKLDPASLRRFAFKVRFDPLTSNQRLAMFREELTRLGGGGEAGAVEAQVSALSGLTPGDFAVAARQFELWDTPANAESLCALLRKECTAKGAAPGKIGFGG